MNTKKCSNCGWVFSTNDPAVYCAICGHEFPGYKVERVYGRVVSVKPVISQYEKETGLSERSRGKLRHYYSEVRRAEEKYRAWLNQIERIPKPYTTLTEDQWLAACNEFNGCALCNSDEIEARGFFIPFSAGGRYCAWNVVPMCEKCATMMTHQLNPFRRMNGQLNSALDLKRGLGKKKVLKVAAYLQERIDEVIG